MALKIVQCIIFVKECLMNNKYTFLVLFMLGTSIVEIVANDQLNNESNSFESPEVRQCRDILAKGGLSPEDEKKIRLNIACVSTPEYIAADRVHASMRKKWSEFKDKNKLCMENMGSLSDWYWGYCEGAKLIEKEQDALREEFGLLWDKVKKTEAYQVWHNYTYRQIFGETPKLKNELKPVEEELEKEPAAQERDKLYKEILNKL